MGAAAESLWMLERTKLGAKLLIDATSPDAADEIQKFYRRRKPRSHLLLQLMKKLSTKR
jgi:hypothetical protein